MFVLTITFYIEEVSFFTTVSFIICSLFSIIAAENARLLLSEKQLNLIIFSIVKILASV